MAELVIKLGVAGVLFGLLQVPCSRTDTDGLSINAEYSLPSFTALATIHTDLTVQDQHSIISQVSHANLLTKLYGSQHRQVYQSVFLVMGFFPENCVLSLGCRHSVGPRTLMPQTPQKVCVWCVFVSHTHSVNIGKLSR